MSAGLFVLICPDCGTELQIDPHGNGTCSGCGQKFLSRFGYLIPIDPDPGDLRVDLGVDLGVDVGRAEPPVVHADR